jgi:hypothetical protein
MRKKSGKISALFIISIFALSLVSLAYAAWVDTIEINGEVTTGEVKWEFGPFPPGLTDVWGPPPIFPTNTPDWNCDPNLGFYGDPVVFLVDKNVGWGEVFIVDPDTIQLNIYNAYPGYYNHMDFWVHALGTIPIKINSVIITNETGVEIITIDDVGIYEFDISGDDVNDMQIVWGNEFGDQLHHCDWRDRSFGFCFLQPLPQSSIIVIYISVIAVQWNEYPYDFT